MANIKIQLPLDEKTAVSLKAGDTVLMSGIIYTGRDAAHKRLYECIQKGETLPVDLKDQLIYYVGPTPAKPGYAVGSAGPTSSYRMDPYTPALLDLGALSFTEPEYLPVLANAFFPTVLEVSFVLLIVILFTK